VIANTETKQNELNTQTPQLHCHHADQLVAAQVRGNESAADSNHWQVTTGV